MTLATGLMMTGVGLMGVLGAIHLVFTFSGRRFEPRDAGLKASMAASRPVITRQTTVWEAYQGFNVTHSLGLIGLAIVYGGLFGAHPDLMSESRWLVGLGFGLLVSYCATARRYFFAVPTRVMALGCVLYAVGWMLM